MASRFDPFFTDNVINSMGPQTSPRFRQLMTGLIRHVHDFARENELTMDEWMAGVELMNWAGKISDSKRNEGQLVCDIIGLETLIDEIAFNVASEARNAPTATAILGPFFRPDTPFRKNGHNLVETAAEGGEMVFMHGQVVDFESGKPLVGAIVEVWQASTNGMYEQQDPGQVEHNLRGKFVTDDDGRYWFYCLRPTPYPVPNDGPGGKLLKLMDKHPFRPAHIHIIAICDGYKPLTTQIFDRKDEHLTNDSVFAVKDSLIVDFVPRENDPQAGLELKYDVRMAGGDS